MHLSLLENQPIHGLRSLFVATGIVLFVGLSLDWPHSPSWYVVTVAPFLLIFIAAMGLGQGWHCTVWYALSRVGPAGRGGDALRGLLEYRLRWSARLQLRSRAGLASRAQPSGAATFDAALAQAAQALDTAARALPAHATAVSGTDRARCHPGGDAGCGRRAAPDPAAHRGHSWRPECIRGSTSHPAAHLSGACSNRTAPASCSRWWPWGAWPRWWAPGSGQAQPCCPCCWSCSPWPAPPSGSSAHSPSDANADAASAQSS